MAYLKVDGHNGYIKNTQTGVVLNVNHAEIEQAKERKAKRLKEKEEINNLKNEISDIKQMLGKLMEKLDG